MSVVANAPYEFTPKDVRENFPAPLLYIGWEDHLMFCAPFCLPLPPDIQIQVLHIVQEALSNIRKHAQATQVWVDVQTQPHWCVRVRDNGCGFDVQAGPPDSTHVGLSIMRERAQRIGADLCCESGPDGTLIELRLPNLVASRSGGPITQPGALTS